MKPGLCKKTGYSLKDTFIMLIKCLVLTFTFMLIGVTLRNTKALAQGVTYTSSSTSGFDCTIASHSEVGSGGQGSTTGECNLVLETINNPYLSEDSGDPYIEIQIVPDYTESHNAGEITVYSTDEDGNSTNVYSKGQSAAYSSSVSKNTTATIVLVFTDNYPTKTGVTHTTSGTKDVFIFNEAFKDNATIQNPGFAKYTICAYENDNGGSIFNREESYCVKLDVRNFESASSSLRPTNFSVQSSNSMADVGYTNTTEFIGTITMPSHALARNAFSYVRISPSDINGTSRMTCEITSDWYNYDYWTTSFSFSCPRLATDYANTTGVYFSFAIYYTGFDDYLGQSATNLVSIYYDNTVPTLESFSITGNADAEEGYTNQTTLSLSSGAATGFNYYRVVYTYGGTEYVLYSKNATKPTTVTFTSKGQGTYTFKLQVLDRAGNKAEKTDTIYYDSVAPTASGSLTFADGDLSDNDITPLSGYTNTSSLELTSLPSYTETGSGIIKYKIVEVVTTTIIWDSATIPTVGTIGDPFALPDAEDVSIYMFAIAAYDRAGNVSETASFQVTYDTTAPTISAFSVIDPSVTGNNIASYTSSTSGFANSTLVGFSAASPSDTNLWKYKVTDTTNAGTDSEVITTPYSLRTTAIVLYNQTSSSRITIQAVEGQHIITYYVYDKAGQLATKTFNLRYDVTAPVVQLFIMSDADASNNNGMSSIVAGYSNNATAQKGYTNNILVGYSRTPTFVETYPWKVKVVDTVVSTGTTKDLYSLSAANVTAGSTASILNVIGEHEITYYLYDRAGNVGIASVTMVYDPPSTSPVITDFMVVDGDLADNAIDPFVSSDGVYTNSTSIKYSAIGATDTNIYKYKVVDKVVATGATSTIYGVSTGQITVNSTTSTIQDVEGLHEITYYVYDKACNMTTTTLNLVYDKTAPEIEDINIIGNENADAGYTSITGVRLEEAPDITDENMWQYRIVINGNENANAYGFSEEAASIADILTLPGEQGTHTITYYVYDKAGNVNFVEDTIIYDSITPVINSFTGTGNAEADEGYTNTLNIRFLMDITEENIKLVEMYDGDLLIASSSESLDTHCYTLEDDTHGVHQIKLYVHDKAGNVNVITSTEDIALFELCYDPLAPRVLDFSVTGNADAVQGYTNTLENLYVRQMSTDDNLSGIKMYKILADGSSVYGPSTTDPFSQLITILDDTVGVHTLQLYVYDRAGNVNEINETSEYSIIYDPDAPVVTLLSVKSNTVAGYTNTSNVRVAQGSEDATTSIQKYEITMEVEGNEEVIYADTEEPATLDLGIDESIERVLSIKLRLYVYDMAGNKSLLTSDAEYTVIFDNKRQILKLANKETDEVISALPGTNLVLKAYDDNHTDEETYAVNYYISTQDNFYEDTGYETIACKVGNEEEDCLDFTNGIVAMNYSRYYVYIFIPKVEVETNPTRDLAGNAIASDESLDTELYYVVKFTVQAIKDEEGNATVEGYVEPIENSWESAKNAGLIVSIDEPKLGTLYATDREQTVDVPANVIQIQAKKFLILTLNHSTCGANNAIPEVEEILTKLGLTLLGSPISSGSGTGAYLNRVITSDSSVFGVLSIIVIDHTPGAPVTCSETSGTVTIEQGSAAPNIGLSLENEELEVTTQVTLDGVTVKGVDTNVTGVYNVVQVIKDKLGRTKKLQREIIVEEASKVEEEKEIEVEEVIEPLEVIVPVKVVEVVQEQVQVEERVEIENNKVEMRLEKKVKVRGYKKKKQIKKVNKERFTFKLFSKYFFKIYDG